MTPYNHYEAVKRWPRKSGKAEYLRFLGGGRLTRDEAIRAKCYECVGGEVTGPCTAVSCPQIQYCQWNTSTGNIDSGDTEV